MTLTFPGVPVHFWALVKPNVDHDYVHRLELEDLKEDMTAMKLELSYFLEILKTDQKALQTSMFGFQELIRQ